MFAPTALSEDGGAEPLVAKLGTLAASTLNARFAGPYFEDPPGDPGTHRDGDPRLFSESPFTAQLKRLGAGGGTLNPADGWAWAFPVRDAERRHGFLVALREAAPQAEELVLLALVAQLTGLGLVASHSQDLLRATAETAAVAERRAEHLARMVERLSEVVLGQDGLEAVADTIRDLVELPVEIEDQAGRLLASADLGEPSAGTGPEEPTGSSGQVEEVVRLEDRLALTLARGGEVLARVSVVDPDAESDVGTTLALRCGAMAVAAELARLQLSSDADERLRQALVEELITGTDVQNAFRRAQLLDVDLERPHRVLVVGGGRIAGPDELERAVRRGLRDLGWEALVSTRASRVVLLLEDGQRWAELPPAVAANSASGLAHVGVGGACHVAGDYPRSYREAERALRLADLADGPRLSVYEELGVYQLFADLREPEALGSFVERWIGPLLAYDTAHGADLVHTLTEYLEAGGNYDHTAAALILHRSTLRYRLRRIREITGLDLNDPDTRFNLQLATRARHSLERIGGNAPVIG